MSPSELSSVCGGGKLTRIECSTVAGIPDIYTGELLTCSVDRGLDCLNIDNVPVTCSDYKVRYSCNCSGKRDSNYIIITTTYLFNPFQSDGFTQTCCYNKYGIVHYSVLRVHRLTCIYVTEDCF